MREWSRGIQTFSLPGPLRYHPSPLSVPIPAQGRPDGPVLHQLLLVSHFLVQYPTLFLMWVRNVKTALAFTLHSRQGALALSFPLACPASPSHPPLSPTCPSMTYPWASPSFLIESK